MENNVFAFKDYKAFLGASSGGKRQRLGIKSKLAAALRCQSTYISQVIHGQAHFSLEQAERVGRFFGFSAEEQKYFLLLVQRARAGTAELRKFFEQEIEAILEKRMNLKERLGERKGLTKEHQSIYYSSWHYAAIHVAVTMPALQTRERLAKALKVSKKRIAEVVNFLIEIGLVVEVDGLLKKGPDLRLGKDSENIIKHHSNWRLRAIDSLEQEDSRDLHYSAIVSLSRNDATKIKDMILDSLKKNLDIIYPSPAEELYCYTLDFFNLSQRE